MISTLKQMMNDPEIIEVMNFGRTVGSSVFSHVMDYYKKREKTLGLDECFYGLYREAYKQADRIIPNDNRLPCRKGCHYCCHLRVSVSVPELAAIVYHLHEKWNENQIKNLTRKLSEYPSQKILDVNYWVENGVPCVFLEHDACNIYKVRPFICRAMNSLEPDRCREGYEDRKVLTHAYEGKRKIFFEGVSNGIEKKAAKLYGQKVYTIEFQNSLFLALTTPDWLSRWQEGDDIFKPYRVSWEKL